MPLSVAHVITGQNLRMPEKAVIDDGDRVNDHELPRLEQANNESSGPAQRIAENGSLRFDFAHVGFRSGDVHPHRLPRAGNPSRDVAALAPSHEDLIPRLRPYRLDDRVRHDTIVKLFRSADDENEGESAP